MGYFLLGSVSPEFLKTISESLAGRVGILEFTPFLYSEVANRKAFRLALLWLRGGYPEAISCSFWVVPCRKNPLTRACRSLSHGQLPVVGICNSIRPGASPVSVAACKVRRPFTNNSSTPTENTRGCT